MPVPFADVHCHLCAGLDDGPRTLDEAVEMCQMAWSSGTHYLAATAHQSRHWPKATKEKILQRCHQLRERLDAEDVRVEIFPTGEVLIDVDLFDQFEQDKLVTVGNRDAYLLVEFPGGTFFDLDFLLRGLAERQIRPILAHPERYPQFLLEKGQIERVIALGALVQVNASSVINLSGEDQNALRSWFRRGVVHLVGSDGHRTDHRQPLMHEAYRIVSDWANQYVADRVFSINGATVLQGMPLRISPPVPPERRGWFSFLRKT